MNICSLTEFLIIYLLYISKHFRNYLVTTMPCNPKRMKFCKMAVWNHISVPLLGMLYADYVFQVIGGMSIGFPSHSEYGIGVPPYTQAR